MYLTREEEQTYDGEYGWAHQICMKILVRLGDLFNAEKLVEIDSAHVSGVSYKTLGRAAEFLQTLADAGGKAKVRATINPQSCDSEYLCKKIGKNLREKQAGILRQFDKMGFTCSLTCTPYHLRKTKPGSHLAWAESSAVVYANSILGAHTNREGGPSALAAAIIGKTPDYGIHQPQNRTPNVLVNVGFKLRNETEFGALGIHLGKLLRDNMPMINGINRSSEKSLKQLSAALGSSGMTNRFCCSHDSSGLSSKALERIEVEKSDIDDTIENLSTAAESKPDLVFLGCPHCSLSEIKQIAGFIGNRKVKKGTEFWVCTSQHVKEAAKSSVKAIEKSGGHVLEGVCTIVSWTEKLGIKTIMTNSAKTAYYAPTLNKADTLLAPTENCLRIALRE